MLPIVLASSSSYRQQLLQRLKIDFNAISPDIDESPLPNESPAKLTERLAISKAKALATRCPKHLIIGSDEVACLEGEIMGKPHHFEQAFKQLKMASGKTVIFYTGLALYNSATGSLQVDTIPFYVHFRELSDSAITKYLEIEKPFDCAGSIKAEGLGICFFKGMEGSDITSLMGLPLIRLVDMLQKEQLFIP
ncbi:Maf family protein [Entomomonas asaccharolytica]|uniref:Nucleoside triphosphate pyrophosphatase n=1 Tax=Entomomonas asaccharolytica TaxID=2785331 RepID=A0A974RVT6_9GAMM|nr:nucleoside triphosphate pyrophosphatase [Entomomonas asaccharolytica]QQP84516.1 septum formation inhibitor Maf [Entomomonas asaccharolytica]